MGTFTPRREKSYIVPSLITLVLYVAGLYIVGFLANIYFLFQINNDEKDGIEVYNAGCLHMMFLLALFPPMFILIAAVMQVLGIIR